MNFREFPPSREEIISLLVILIELFFLCNTLHIQIYRENIKLAEHFKVLNHRDCYQPYKLSSCRFLGFFNQLLNIPFTSHTQLSCLHRAVESCPLLYTVMEEGPVRSPSTPLPRLERYVTYKKNGVAFHAKL